MKQALLFLAIIIFLSCTALDETIQPSLRCQLSSLDCRIKKSIEYMEESKMNHKLDSYVGGRASREENIWALERYDIILGCLRFYEQHRPAVKTEVEYAITFLEGIIILHKVNKGINPPWFDKYCVRKYRFVIATLKDCRSIFGTWEWSEESPNFRR